MCDSYADVETPSVRHSPNVREYSDTIYFTKRRLANMSNMHRVGGSLIHQLPALVYMLGIAKNYISYKEYIYHLGSIPDDSGSLPIMLEAFLSRRKPLGVLASNGGTSRQVRSVPPCYPGDLRVIRISGRILC